MIVQEPIEGTNLVRSYSTLGVYIHGGFPEADYPESIDPVDMHREFVETNIPVREITDAEALAIITGAEYVGAEGGEEA